MAARTITSLGILPLLLISFVAAVIAAEQGGDSTTWARDPFRYVDPVSRGPVDVPTGDQAPALATPVAAPGKGLEGIFVSNGLYRALYDGRLVRPGEQVNGVLIREISLYAVVVEDAEGRRKIELFHEK